jgi:hypothetical protein
MLLMCFVAFFLIPDAIVSTPISAVYFEIMQRFDAVSARAIAGHTTNIKGFYDYALTARMRNNAATDA